eukprot:CAMPEP_0203946214 /NCGR_PEP_ID=MMETSP0359-20131031/81537_1 /ASSEMBLY_ACC=CAM_ASM_000338 /TAXON_ID=268821 /ORGANISM="Scrippsiella Hangoei, Strain SHTV-5" /LENGTH=33 /DNA_ID= /DNA_START= /DNA_END= /DNA_ORIENTATION=
MKARIVHLTTKASFPPLPAALPPPALPQPPEDT